MSGKKDCMFQYAITFKYLTAEIPQDTDLITLDEAKALWSEYLPEFISRRENDNGNPEMVIWINCKNNTDYTEELAHIDDSSLLENGRLYEVTKKEIKI